MDIAKLGIGQVRADKLLVADLAESQLKHGPLGLAVYHAAEPAVVEPPALLVGLAGLLGPGGLDEAFDLLIRRPAAVGPADLHAVAVEEPHNIEKERPTIAATALIAFV